MIEIVMHHSIALLATMKYIYCSPILMEGIVNKNIHRSPAPTPCSVILRFIDTVQGKIVQAVKPTKDFQLSSSIFIPRLWYMPI